MSTSKSAAKYPTLHWVDGALEMLDQRALPARVEYQRYNSAAAVAKGIKTMVVRGAPAIGCAAAYGVALEALRLQNHENDSFLAGMQQGMAVLATSRPTAVNLFWALNRMRAKLDSLSANAVPTIATALLAEAHAITGEDVRLNHAMGSHGAVLLKDRSTVLTHCNAGALATAGHGTALGVVRSAVEAGKRLHVFVDETRPFLQGARLTAWELQQDGIPVTLIADNAAGLLMRLGEINAVIVGADRVAANGDVANKIGTYSVAVLARRHGIPFYVAAPLSTIDPAMPSGAEIPIEERAATEVTGYGDTQWAPHGVAVRNPVFDVTPAELVTALITERGVVFTPDNAKIGALMAGPMQTK
jgi:methylthioribose-1-phosphate isomerase